MGELVRTPRQIIYEVLQKEQSQREDDYWRARQQLKGITDVMNSPYAETSLTPAQILEDLKRRRDEIADAIKWLAEQG